MDDDLKSLAAGYLAGSLDGGDRLADRLKADPAALSEFVDQVQMHHRLGVLLRGGDPLTAAVIRELKLLPDSPRFSREVVERVKQLESPGRRTLRMLPLWAAAAIFLVVIAVVVFRRSDPAIVAAGPRKILFVVGQVPPGPGDAPVLARLGKLGFSVELKSAKTVVATDGAHQDLVLISSTALAEDVVDPAAELQIKFRDLPVPILTWEPMLLHELGMIEGSTHGKDWASSKGPMTLTILRKDHPLAAGLSGSVRVAEGMGRCSWGRARSDALQIATVERDDARAAIFGYEKGAAMPGLVAPARRLSFFLFDHTSPSLTPEGWALFDAALRWCAHSPK